MIFFISFRWLLKLNPKHFFHLYLNTLYFSFYGTHGTGMPMCRVPWMGRWLSTTKLACFSDFFHFWSFQLPYFMFSHFFSFGLFDYTISCFLTFSLLAFSLPYFIFRHFFTFGLFDYTISCFHTFGLFVYTISYFGTFEYNKVCSAF